MYDLEFGDIYTDLYNNIYFYIYLMYRAYAECNM